MVWLALRYFELWLTEYRRCQQKTTVNSYDIDLFLQCDGPSYLEALEFHENIDIRNKAIYLLETFYETDSINSEFENSSTGL